MIDSKSNGPCDLIVANVERASFILSKISDPAQAADIADMAEAARVYAKRAGASFSLINRASEIKLEAERKAGELLAGMSLHGGDRSKVTECNLAQLGLTKTQSSRWQRIAKVSEDTFRKFIDDNNSLGKEITTSGLLKLATKEAPKNGARTPDVLEGICTDLSELVDAGQKFGAIYADPPWRYNNQGTRAATDNHYDGDLSIEQLCELPIGELAAEKCHLHLWTTNAFLFECPKLFDAWGFEFKSSFVWVKPSMGIGNYWRNSHEIMLLAIRGGQTAISRAEKSWVECKRGMHSAKPEHVRHSIERLSPGPYLELFGRSPRTGWTVFGNQIVEELVKL